MGVCKEARSVGGWMGEGRTERQGQEGGCVTRDRLKATLLTRLTDPSLDIRLIRHKRWQLIPYHHAVNHSSGTSNNRRLTDLLPVGAPGWWPLLLWVFELGRGVDDLDSTAAWGPDLDGAVHAARQQEGLTRE